MLRRLRQLTALYAAAVPVLLQSSAACVSDRELETLSILEMSEKF